MTAQEVSAPFNKRFVLNYLQACSLESALGALVVKFKLKLNKRNSRKRTQTITQLNKEKIFNL